MKTIVSMLVGAAMLYRGTKISGVHSLSDVKDLLGMEFRSILSRLRKDLKAV